MVEGVEENSRRLLLGEPGDCRGIRSSISIEHMRGVVGEEHGQWRAWRNIAGACCLGSRGTAAIEVHRMMLGEQ